MTDEDWMRYALRLAQRAEMEGEVPVGALLIQGQRCIATGWNQSIQTHDPSAHAEMVAIRAGGKVLQNYRLPNTTLYVTLEPCVMCMGAIIQARISRLVFGAQDAKRGAVCNALQLSAAPFLNHKLEWQDGILAQNCAELLTDFFKGKRLKN